MDGGSWLTVQGVLAEPQVHGQLVGDGEKQEPELPEGDVSIQLAHAGLAGFGAELTSPRIMSASSYQSFE